MPSGPKDSIRATFASPAVSFPGDPIAACDLSLIAKSAPLRSGGRGDGCRLRRGTSKNVAWIGRETAAAVQELRRTHSWKTKKNTHKNTLVHSLSLRQAGVVIYPGCSGSLLSWLLMRAVPYSPITTLLGLWGFLACLVCLAIPHVSLNGAHCYCAHTHPPYHSSYV